MARPRKEKVRKKELLDNLDSLVFAAGFPDLHSRHRSSVLRVKMRRFLGDRGINVWDARTLEDLVERVKSWINGNLLTDIADFDRCVDTRDDHIKSPHCL